MSRENEKRVAAAAAAAEVCDSMLVGLGTGSTTAFLIEELGRRCAEGLRIEAVATSRSTETAARAVGIPLRDMRTVETIDLAIDGADEIDPRLRAIKGAGGALLREKIVGAAATRMVVIVDASKRVARLGAVAVPIEVLPFACAFVAARVVRLGGVASLRTVGEGFLTDQGNVILDCHFHEIDDPERLAAALAEIPGLLGHGLFLHEIDAAYVGCNGVVERIERLVS